MKKLGHVNVGSAVEAAREQDDDEFEPCKVRNMYPQQGLVDLTFADGFVRKSVPLSELKFLEAASASTDASAAHEADAKAAEADAKAAEAAAADELAYKAEVQPQLPTPPTKDAMAADEDAKYAYIKAYKDAGNALFKAGKYAWAIRTYCDAVDALQRHCYESRERMLWDYFARGPCGQCYSNAALCALKGGEHARAARLCEQAMECRPEDTDLVKVLLRSGQALLGLGRAADAKAALERAADKEPANRSVREELLRAKKAVKAEEDVNASRLFASVDLHKKGLTSKREAALEQLTATVDGAFAHLVEHRDEDALRMLEPLLEGAASGAEHRKPTTMLAAYGVGIARYHLQKQLGDQTIAALKLFFELKAELDAGGADYAPPLMGVPLARFYYAHALFEAQRLEPAREQLGLYFADVKAAGPQKIINMPSSMLGGKDISEAERGASRFKARAVSADAQADACMMLAIIADRAEGPAASVPHLVRCVEIATKERQQADAHEHLARAYQKLGEHEKAAEQRELAKQKHEAAMEKEEAEKRKREEEARQEAEVEEQSTAHGAAEGAAEGASEADVAAGEAPDVSEQ